MLPTKAMLIQVETIIWKNLPPIHNAFAALFCESKLIALKKHDLFTMLRLIFQAIATFKAVVNAEGAGVY